jgi:hypothetical protein
MVLQPTAKSEPKRGGCRVRFPGIVRHAKSLGVERSHLYRVLTGERQTPLLARYQALVSNEPKTTKPKSQ